MKVKQNIILGVVAAFFVADAVAVAKDEWNGGEGDEWRPLPANDVNNFGKDKFVFRVDSRIKERLHYKSGNGEWCWQFRNRYQRPVKVKMTIFTVNENGERKDETSSATIGANAEYRSGGNWTISAKPIEMQTLKIQYADGNDKPSSERQK